jgi:hypothetical protein
MESQDIIQYSTADKSLNYSQLKHVLMRTVNANLEKPRHEHYLTLQSRIDSFSRWPLVKKQKPDELAKAGLYYNGVADEVKCFFCNGGLSNWQQNDVPIEEHVRWYPKCPYVRQLMGMSFLEAMKEKFKNVESGFEGDFSYEMTRYYNLEDQNTTTQSSERPSRLANNRVKEREISPTVVLARLDLPAVRKIMNLGFKESTVKRAIENKLRRDGDDFKNLVDLVDACFNIDENDKKLENKLRETFDLVLFNVSKYVDRFQIKSLFETKIHVRPKIIRLIIKSKEFIF